MANPTATPSPKISPALNQIAPQGTRTEISVPSQWDTFIKPYEPLIAQTAVNGFVIFAVWILTRIVQPELKKAKYKLSATKRQEDDIEQILIELRLSTKCDRVLLSQFTNGEFAISEYSIKGCTITHEITDIGIEKVAGDINSRIKSYSHFILKSLIKNPCQKKIAEELDNGSYRQFLGEIQTVFLINYFLVSNDQPLGFLSFHWRSPKSFSDFESVTEKDIRKYADAITSRLLNTRDVWDSIKSIFGKNQVI
jgi:hypothetical protein